MPFGLCIEIVILVWFCDERVRWTVVRCSSCEVLYADTWACSLYSTQWWASGSGLFFLFHCIHDDFLLPQLFSPLCLSCESVLNVSSQSWAMPFATAARRSCMIALLPPSCNRSLAPASHQNICILSVSLPAPLLSTVTIWNWYTEMLLLGTEIKWEHSKGTVRSVYSLCNMYPSR